MPDVRNDKINYERRYRMFELVKVSGNDSYIDCPAKIGLVKVSDSEVVLIDSGSDKDAGKKVLKILDANHWNVKAVYNTHSHADHIGGNRLIQERTGCEIYAKGLETVFANNPELEPIGLYGGLPFHDLENKFLKAQASSVREISGTEGNDNLNLLPLPGHSPDMTGFLTKDGTAYIGDSVASEETLKKYGICYMWNYKEAIASLEFLKTVDAKCFVPAHAPATADIRPLADANIEAIRSVRDAVLELCTTPCTFETLLKRLFDRYGLTMNVQQYALTGSTLRSYLSALYTEVEAGFRFAGNEMIWFRIGQER